MNALRKILPFFYCWLGCVAIQLPMVWWLYPNPQDFSSTATVQGIYDFNGGGARTGATTKIGARSLFCGISYLGPAGGCKQELAGQFVTAKLATYKHLFGAGEFLVEARATSCGAHLPRAGQAGQSTIGGLEWQKCACAQFRHGCCGGDSPRQAHGDGILAFACDASAG